MPKVLVVDDSALMRKHLKRIIESAGFTVETARNGQEGIDKAQSFDPDCITLDINMPVMDGITCLAEIMRIHPKPVVMVSSLTEQGALVTFEALELGAIDYVKKPGGTVSLNLDDSAEELIAKVKSATRTKVRDANNLRSRLRRQREERARESQLDFSRRINKTEVVVIGVSTGGPGSLQELFESLPADFPVPIVVAQHMPSKFTKVFAERLNRQVPMAVSEVTRPTHIQPSNVYIAKGDADIKFIERSGKRMVTSVPSDKTYLWHPSVEKLVASAADVFDPKRVICVQMTGMGNDGAHAMTTLHQQGARTIAEAESSAVVYGMPRELVELGGADKVLDLSAIGKQLVEWVK